MSPKQTPKKIKNATKEKNLLTLKKFSDQPKFYQRTFSGSIGDLMSKKFPSK